MCVEVDLLLAAVGGADGDGEAWQGDEERAVPESRTAHVEAKQRKDLRSNFAEDRANFARSCKFCKFGGSQIVEVLKVLQFGRRSG